MSESDSKFQRILSTGKEAAVDLPEALQGWRKKQAFRTWLSAKVPAARLLSPIDFGNSLDKIGPMTRTAYESALFQEVISGYDTKDSTSLNAEVGNYTNYIGKSVKGMKVGIIKESFG